MMDSLFRKFFQTRNWFIREIHSKLWTEKPNGLIVDDLNTELRNEISDLQIEKIIDLNTVICI